MATTIFSLLVVSVSLLFRSGISVRKRIESEQETLSGVYLNLERIARELRNAVLFRRNDAGFLGDEKQIEFYTIFLDYHENSPKILRVNYRFEDQDLTRTLREPFQDDKEKPLSRFAFFEDVINLSFSFFDHQKQEWEDQWEDKGNLPSGIKIALAYRDGKGEVSHINKYVFMYR